MFFEVSQIVLSCLSETSADETTVVVSRKGITQRFEFFNFKEHKFSFLNITALAKRVFKDSLSCAFSCLDNLACFSLNFAAFPDEAGKFTCEILSSDKYNNSNGFLPSKNFHHFSIVVSNLSLNFVLIFGEPECLIKRQNSRFLIRNCTFMGKGARISILFSDVS